MIFRLALVLSLLLGLLLPSATADSCSTFSDCDSCRATTLCHWCPDGQCHAIGSIHGCIYGAYCYNNDVCQRGEPEYRGYARPSFAAVLGVGVVCGTFAMCAVAAIVLARDFAQQSAAEEEEDDACGGGGYFTLASDDSDVERYPAPSAPPPPPAAAAKAPGSSYTPLAVAEITGGRGWRLRSGATRARARAGARRSLRLRRRLSGRLYAFTAAICGAAVVLVLAAAALVLSFAPHVPVINVCNTQFDWGSIAHSIKRAQVEADFEILLSIYNPNYMDVEIEGGSAVLRHKHAEIGHMAFEPFRAAGGYITDVLLVVEIDAEMWDDLHLGYEFETGALAFFMDATVTAAVTWRGHKTYPFAFSISNYYIRAADATGGDRSVCNCPDIMHLSGPV